MIQPTLRIIQLSDSFRSLWTDLAQELGVQTVLIEADDIHRTPTPGSVASIVAAGGEEDRALELLLSLEDSRAVPTFLVGAEPSHRFAIEAVRRGATDYFVLPEDLDLLRRTLTSRVDQVRERAPGQAREAHTAFDALVGESAALRDVLEKAKRVMAHRDVTVLIGGETGTGKELLAHGIHNGGPRADGPFVAVNCAAIPGTLLESELFGHEKGAFTDAHTAKLGLFEEANGGTLFLDEIGHLPLELQGKLLRALDEKRIRRVGGNEHREIDVRIIAATHVDLDAAVQRGEFRQDLYYRLNVVFLQLPPLAERGQDIELLAREFATSLAERYGTTVPPITPDLVLALHSHTWPGNVRELRHAIERALLLSQPGSLDPSELVPSPARRTSAHAAGIPFPATLRDINVAAAQRTVELCGGNKSEAARKLGISRARLQRLLDDEADQ